MDRFVSNSPEGDLLIRELTPPPEEKCSVFIENSGDVQYYNRMCGERVHFKYKDKSLHTSDKIIASNLSYFYLLPAAIALAIITVHLILYVPDMLEIGIISGIFFMVHVIPLLYFSTMLIESRKITIRSGIYPFVRQRSYLLSAEDGLHLVSLRSGRMPTIHLFYEVKGQNRYIQLYASVNLEGKTESFYRRVNLVNMIVPARSSNPSNLFKIPGMKALYILSGCAIFLTIVTGLIIFFD